MVLFLLLLVVAVALGVIGALGRDTLYLLIIGVMVLIADLVLPADGARPQAPRP